MVTWCEESERLNKVKGTSMQGPDIGCQNSSRMRATTQREMAVIFVTTQSEEGVHNEGPSGMVTKAQAG